MFYLTRRQFGTKFICMKKLKSFFLPIWAFLILLSCNSPADDKGKTAEKADGKTTELTASTKSTEAAKAFAEGLAAFDLNDIKKARIAFSEAIKLDPNLGIAYLYRSNTASSSKEYADDVKAGNAKLDSASNWEKMYGEYLNTNLNGDRIKGLGILQKMATEYPDAARAQNDLGIGYTNSNQFDKAREVFQKVVKLNPNWVGGYASLVGSYLFNDPKDFKKAEENAMKLTELAPNSAGSQISLGDCFRAQNDFEKAKGAYTKAVVLDSVSPEGYYKLGHANTYLGNYDEARKNYASGGKNDVTKMGSVSNIAYSYLYQGNAAAATKELMDAAAKADSNANSEKSNYYGNCATIAIHNGDAATLKKLIPKILPLSEKINNDLGSAEAKTFMAAEKLNWASLSAYMDGKYDEAKAKAEEMKTTMNPINDDRKLENYHSLMGMIYMKQKNYPDAIMHFEKSDPNNIYNKYLLAKANEAAGNKDKATAAYKEVAAYNFNDVSNALVRTEVKKKLAMP